jgi:hypothetical protein
MLDIDCSILRIIAMGFDIVNFFETTNEVPGGVAAIDELHAGLYIT